MARIGLMGCGTVATYGHLPAIATTEGLTLAAVFDPSPAAVEAAAAKYGVPGFTDPEAFFAVGMDGVSITSPAPYHAENAAAAARHGVHVLCEKPLGTDDTEIAGMIRTADAAGTMLFTAFDYRFSPISQTIYRLVREGAVGEVRSLRLIYIWNCHGKYATVDGRRVLQARRAARMDEGGPMVDCGVHQIDLARWWTGSEVVRWSSAGAWVDEFAAPDHLYLHMDHANGVHTMVELSYSYNHTSAEASPHFTYELIGTEGVIRFDREAGLFEVRNTRGTEILPTAPEKNFAGMYVAFAEALARGGSDVLPTGRDGLEATRLARGATDAVMAARLAGV
jgi:predicted dehydrogenase